MGIRMDHHGLPTHLFTTNRWVTGETVYAASDAVSFLDRFVLHGDWPSQEANRWLSAMFILFRPQMERLLHARDAVLESRRPAHRAAGTDIFEDRDLNVISMCTISIVDQLDWLGLLD